MRTQEDISLQWLLSRGYTPVSYTHLDVYKRQLLSPTNGVVQGFAELVDVDREAILHCLGDGHHMAGPVPVSYTHLDVYKRQGCRLLLDR